MALSLQFDADELRSLVVEIVRETLAEVEESGAKASGRIGLTEPEAAALLGVRPHVLRDLRLAGEIRAARVGRRVIYERAALEKLVRDRIE